MKLTKKILAVVLSVLFVVGVFAGCSSKDANTKDTTTKASASSDMKVGFIFLHDENSTYDKNFITAADEACKTLGIADENKIYKTNVPEGQECTEAALDLVDKGCSIIFADSFGHEPYIIEVAKKHPEVQFCHSTGTRAHTEGLDNYHNAFASIYEGRYLAGIAAGMKLNQMIKDGKFEAKDAKIGYVGAYTYAEVISGYTSLVLVQYAQALLWKFSSQVHGMMKLLKRKLPIPLLLTAVSLSASMLTQWVLLQLVKQQVFLTFLTTAQQ